MNFQENLVRARKARGLSQEDLAAKVGVSRQAVSKWESGGASPDLPKLLALADALELSLDDLCGREAAPAAAPGPDTREEPPAAEAASAPVRRKGRWLVPALCGSLLAGALFGGAWSRRSVVPAESTLPDTFTVSGESFIGVENDRLAYMFTPSIAGEAYTYQITFSALGAGAETFDAPYSGGVCAGTVTLDAYETYLVTATVSNEVSARTAVLAESLSFCKGEARWTPIDE